MSQSLSRQQRRAFERQSRKVGKRLASAFPPPAPTPSQSPEALVDRAEKIELFERLDGYAPLRNGLRRLAKDRSEWAGIPIPMDGHPLTIEPRYPQAEALMALGAAQAKDLDPLDGAKIRNSWRAHNGRDWIVIYEVDGKIDWGRRRHPHNLGMMLDTLDCADAWGIEQEGNAVQTLGQMVRHRQFKQYMLTTMFLETSRRSGVTYIFRRLRPTIAFRNQRILAALCMHPIGYYGGTWAGAMTPTDDVIAHLALMRGDEKLFWRRCEQHSPLDPEAGL